MSSPTGSVSETASGVSSTDALIGDLCLLARRLAKMHTRGDQVVEGNVSNRCRLCGGRWPLWAEPLHGPRCLAGRTLRVIADIQAHQGVARLAAGPEREIVYGAALVDPVLGEMEEVHLPAPPVGISHAEAAVMQAAGVPIEDRANAAATANLSKWPVQVSAVRP